MSCLFLPVHLFIMLCLFRDVCLSNALSISACPPVHHVTLVSASPSIHNVTFISACSSIDNVTPVSTCSSVCCHACLVYLPWTDHHLKAAWKGAYPNYIVSHFSLSKTRLNGNLTQIQVVDATSCGGKIDLLHSQLCTKRNSPPKSHVVFDDSAACFILSVSVCLSCFILSACLSLCLSVCLSVSETDGT